MTEIALWALLAFQVACVGLLAAVPPVSRDALTHHLAVPKLYIRNGGMQEIPEVLFSYYPMNLDLLYLVPLLWQKDIIPKYIHFAFALATAVLIGRFINRRTRRRSWGLLGALLFLSLPVIVKLSISVYVDLGLVFFTTGALLYILESAKGSRQWPKLIYAGIFCGLALGTKYNALIAFFLLTCTVPIIFIRSRRYRGRAAKEGVRSQNRETGPKSSVSFRALGAGLLFALISLAVFSPWMVRNHRWTRNPIYPLYQSIFAAPEAPASALLSSIRPINPQPSAADREPGHFVTRRQVFDETLLETVTIPIRIFFQGRDDNPRYFDGRLNPYLFLLPFLAFIGFATLPAAARIENVALAGFAVLFLLYTFFTVDMRVRYVAPIIAPLVILSVLGLRNLWRLVSEKHQGRRSSLLRAAVVLAMILLLGLNGRYIYDQFNYVKPLSYISGEIDRDAYIANYRSEYPAIQDINRNLAADARILSLYLGNRFYYSDRAIYSGDGFFKEAVQTAGTARQLGEILKSRGFTHLFIRYDFFKRFLLSELSPDKRRLLDEFFNQGGVISCYRDENHLVLELTAD